ncbi:MAG TPA: UDP-3-O-acyl-N-acetylglucosamine deacetylase [bacterium]|nr:UDP-3-O-acyl-N-acetylglucosamine deacetylase [bacterium]
MDRQRTLATAVTCSGIGLHTGSEVTLTLRPAPVDQGIVFVRTDLAGRQKIKAHATKVGGTNFATTLIGDGYIIGTIEHLMAALHGHAIDNVLVELDGDEVPIMDGSAAAFSYLIQSAGVVELQAPRRYLQILKPIEIVEGDKRAGLYPADSFAVTYEIDFPHPMIKVQRFDVMVTPESFHSELASARTFGFLTDVTMMRDAGLANGGGLNNAIVIGNYSVLNKGGLRYPDEFVRHKVMDAIGDVFLAGYPILGRLHAVKSGHALNHKLVMRLLAEKSSWRIVEGRPRRQKQADVMPMRPARARSI